MIVILYHGKVTADPNEAGKLMSALKKLGKPGEVKIYPGAPHAFFNDTRKDVYRQKEAQDAWRRTFDFFSKHLKG